NDPNVTIAIPPASIAIDQVTAARITDQITVTLAGFDNTFTAGSMSFSFFDRNGQLYGSNIPADFTAAFRTFFTSTGASVFRTVLTFPASGDLASITGVEAELKNSAGTTRSSRISF
ncbi:MAG: hypothetical protein ABI995_15640, partial [Acidobacteriota bacterium]